MLLPEPMSRIVIVGNKSRLDEAIEALYELRLLHLIDHTTGLDEGYSIGAPRPYSEKASERLLTLRAVEKELEINAAKEADEQMSAKAARAKISADRVESIGEEVFKVIDRKVEVVQKIAEENAKKEELTLITGIPVDLDLYKGYGSILAIVGSVSKDPSSALAAIADSELFVAGTGKKKDEKRIIALFIRKEEKENAMRILTDFEFTEIQVPNGKGPAAAAIAEAEANMKELNAKLEEINKELAVLKEKHGADIIALDEELSIESRKGDTPLRIATSEHSFVVDAWVPTAKVKDAITGMDRLMGGNIYVEALEDRSRSLHDVEHAEDRFKETPTKMKNGAYAKHFEYPVKLLSPPKYQEIDPTIILSIFFPLFFGFMVGDVGYAIPFIILGAYGLRTAKHKDFRAIATVLFFGGIWAFIFGFFFFGEMFGMHFVGEIAAGDKSITWQSLFGLHFPDWFVNIFPVLHPHVAPGEVIHYGVSKVVNVTFLLKISIYIGVIHVLLGFIVGFVNAKMQHGTKAAFFHKGGWIMSFLGIVMFAYAMTEVMIFKKPMEGTPFYILIAGIALLVAGIAVSFKSEGIQAILEVPGLFGNILSYARLTAIGMSKAGMALAFNYISITMIAAGLGGIPGIIVGLVMFSFLHLVIWTLAILSAGLHALRLQYVEMMSKFFEGGGKEYEPLEIKRINTKIVETEV